MHLNREPIQVKNVGHCIKLAVDFLSCDLETLDACHELANEFRARNLQDPNHVDVLEFDRHILFGIKSILSHCLNLSGMRNSEDPTKRKRQMGDDGDLEQVRCPHSDCARKKRWFPPSALAQH